MDIRVAKMPSLFRFVNSDITVNAAFIEALIAKTAESPNVSELNFEKLITEMPIYKSLEVEFRDKLQKVYDNVHIQDLIDGDRLLLEFKMIDFFNKISSSKYNCYLHTGQDPTEAILEDAVIKALCVEKILYISKFNSYARAFRPLYNVYMKNEARLLFKRLTLKQKMKYILWKRHSGYAFEGPSFMSYLKNIASDEREPKQIYNYEIDPFNKKNTIKEEIKDYLDDKNLVLTGGYLFRKITRKK